MEPLQTRAPESRGVSEIDAVQEAPRTAVTTGPSPGRTSVADPGFTAAPPAFWCSHLVVGQCSRPVPQDGPARAARPPPPPWPSPPTGFGPSSPASRPRREATARVLGGYRPHGRPTGAGARPPRCAPDGLAAILATAARPRTDGRGVESPTTAHRRGRLDAVIASLLFMGGLRRSEVAAVRCRRDGRPRRRRRAAHRADLENKSRGGRRRRAVSQKRRREGDPHPSRRRRRRRPHGSGGRVVPATDSAPLHRGRPAPPASRRA